MSIAAATTAVPIILTMVIDETGTGVGAFNHSGPLKYRWHEFVHALEEDRQCPQRSKLLGQSNWPR